jgi:hypothetical protein
LNQAKGVYRRVAVSTCHATVTDVFRAAAVVPSPPLLIPPLGGFGDAEVARLRSGVAEAVRRLAAVASRWTVVGVDACDAHITSDRVGTFAGFGADVPVALSGRADGEPDPNLPLAALVAAGLRTELAPGADCEVRIVAAATSAAGCARLGAALRAELDADPSPRGLLVVGDGATTLTERSPGYLHPDAAAAQRTLDDALRTGDRAALAAMDPARCAELGIAGRAAFAVLAAAFDTEPTVSTYYCAAPFGVGYYAGVWQP